MAALTEAEYREQVEPLLHELSDAARWIAETGQRLVVLFEGRDTAGKGGSIYMCFRSMSARDGETLALDGGTDGGGISGASRALAA